MTGQACTNGNGGHTSVSLFVDSNLADYLEPPMSKQFRIFRNHYLCSLCPHEWSDEMMVVGPSYCPCCDAEAEPYDSEALLEDVLVIEEAE